MTPSMDLPPCIGAYFDADSRNDAEGVMAAFSPHALVEDENRRHAGHAAIGAWWAEAKQKTPHVTAPLEATMASDITCVRARVSGDFPGSPVTLHFTFTVRDGLIQHLEIAP